MPRQQLNNGPIERCRAYVTTGRCLGIVVYDGELRGEPEKVFALKYPDGG